MKSAVLLVLGGLCSGRGTLKCRSGCPGAFAVRGERQGFKQRRHRAELGAGWC